jgi:4-amino-4-deoxychorismate lyase
MNHVSLINGVPGEHVALSDRGLHYGDGLFETLAVRDGVCEFWDRHMQRLQLGCERLHIPPPSPTLLRDEAATLIHGRECAVLKIIITRGSGGRGYQVPLPALPARILRVSPQPDHPASHARDGVAVRICDQRLGHNVSLAGLKHLNRLEQVLARLEWETPEIAEGLMLDTEGRVIEGTFTNLFLVDGEHLLTPELNRCGVAGIMRGVVLDIAQRIGLACAERDIDLDDLGRADELFLTNSLIGIWPVRTLEARRLPVGDITRRLQTHLEKQRNLDCIA